MLFTSCYLKCLFLQNIIHAVMTERTKKQTQENVNIFPRKTIGYYVGKSMRKKQLFQSEIPMLCSRKFQFHSVDYSHCSN